MAFTADTSERSFEDAIEGALLTGGPDDPVGGDERAAYRLAGYRRREPDRYDRARCLLPDDLLDFVIATQPEQWATLTAQHGEARVRERFLDRVAKQVAERGTLDVLRKGVTDLGSTFRLAFFQPETDLNAEHARGYEANVLSIVRQLRYSARNDNSLDLVLFANGLPVITAELKTPLRGQTVRDAIAQYRTARDPKEPLFAFGRCVAHFAVDPDDTFMTTELRGEETRFLPFNRGGEHGGAGNPPNPRGYRTSYLWEEIWQRDSLLDILQHFAQVEELRDERNRTTGQRRLIFPRYHQLTAVRQMVAHARQRGAGQRYLVQHSAGSGKSNTIAWLAHRLTGLHDSTARKVFDSIVIITDRRNLDQQLRGTVRSFEQVRGIVTAIEHHKASELARALETGATIIVTTLQTFPFVMTKLSEDARLAGRHYAVIIDEAHSSQTGEGVISLKQVLRHGGGDAADAGEDDADDSESLSGEDLVNQRVEQAQATRGRLAHVSFFAFTATPKNKTLELFGVQEPDGAFRPFSLYTMRQAIEEGFILDVLQGYTTYKVYFGLLKRVEDDPRYEKRKALTLIRNYVDLHEFAVAEKTAIMLDHFERQVRGRILGQAKAMVVTRSRLSAVRYKLAFERELRRRAAPYKALVAFSGEVTDPETHLTYTESQLNGGIPETRTAETFKGPDYRILIVANKFQTGFDQPLLHTMYVDKKLGGVNAVQTLSRLNRTHPDKDDTFVLDFANTVEEIQQAFQPYYEATLLSEPTDPNKLYDLKDAIERLLIFGESDVRAFAYEFFGAKPDGGRLHALLDPAADRYRALDADAQEETRKLLGDFTRLYAFLGQILTFRDPSLETVYQYTRHLLRKLPVERDTLPVELVQHINMESFRVQQTSSGDIRLIAEDGQLKPISELGTQRAEPTLAPLSEILAYINEHFGTAFTDADKVQLFADDMQRRLEQHDGLRLSFALRNNSEDNRRIAFYGHYTDVLHEMMGANTALYQKLVDDPEFGTLFRELMLQRYAGGAG